MTTLERPQGNNGRDFLAKMSRKNKQQNALAHQADRLMLGNGVDVQSATARRNGSELLYGATGNYVVDQNGRVEVAPTEHKVSDHVEKQEKSIEALNPEAEKFHDLTSDEYDRLIREFADDKDDADYRGDDDNYRIPASAEFQDLAARQRAKDTDMGDNLDDEQDDDLDGDDADNNPGFTVRDYTDGEPELDEDLDEVSDDIELAEPDDVDEDEEETEEKE